MGKIITKTLLDRVDLRRLAEEAGAVFRNDSSICPLHPGADNPSAFHLYQGQDTHWRWHCFTRCPEGANGGDAIAFYMYWQNVDFRTAVRELGQRVGLDMRQSDPARLALHKVSLSSPSPPLTSAVKPPNDRWRERARAFVAYAQKQLWSAAGQQLLSYLHTERGLSDDTIRYWGLGYNPRDVWDDPARWGLTGKRIWCPRGLVFSVLRDDIIWNVKVRRPLPGDALAQAIGAIDRLPDVKFSGPRGAQAALFGANHLAGLPVLLLTEGEPDMLLAWQAVQDFCDVASLGGAKHHLDVLDAVALTRASVILAVYDLDAAGKLGNDYLCSISHRVVVVEPPDHDLTDYWRQGGNLRAWIAAQVVEHMEPLLRSLDDQQHPGLFIKCLEIYERALCAC